MLPNLEKRRYPRVSANFDARVDCGDGFRVRVTVLDTSTTGLRLQCNGFEREMLTPHGEWIRHGKPIEINVILELPRPNQETRMIEALCTVAFSRRVARDLYHIGMRYKRLDPESFVVLGDFIDRRLKQR
ncbi:MAG: PilZ domain-containing protein [Gammaproteobacteria bacterium]